MLRSSTRGILLLYCNQQSIIAGEVLQQFNWLWCSVSALWNQLLCSNRSVAAHQVQVWTGTVCFVKLCRKFQVVAAVVFLGRPSISGRKAARLWSAAYFPRANHIDLYALASILATPVPSYLRLITLISPSRRTNRTTAYRPTCHGAASLCHT